MANEYNYAVTSQTFQKGSINVSLPNAQPSITVAGTNYVRYSYTATTSDTSLNLGSIGTVGFIFIRNTDATNYVQVGDGTSYNLKLLAGEYAGPVRWGAAAVHVKANTASCVLDVFILEA